MSFRTIEISSAAEIHIKEGQFKYLEQLLSLKIGESEFDENSGSLFVFCNINLFDQIFVHIKCLSFQSYDDCQRILKNY